MAQVLESVHIALQAIWANRLRSFMTVLGNIVAVTSIVTVVSLIQGMNEMVSDAIISDVGADAFTIQQFPPIARTDEDLERARGNPRLTLEEAEAIRRFGGAIDVVMAQAQQRGRVTYRAQVLENLQIQGVTPEYVNFSAFDAERGRLMSPVEVERSSPVALIGWGTADLLFGEATPLDKTIQIEGVHFRVVGVSAPKGAIFGNSQDEFVVIPLGSFVRLFGARPSLSILVRPSSPEQLDDAMDEATVALRVQRRLEARAEDDFGIFTSDTLLGIYEQATTGIFVVLVGIVGLSLVVGGIVIMNIMLMVVSERTREIGLRKALGAKRRDIMSQVLTESITLSTVGGVAGIALGWVLAQAIAAVSPLPARLEPWSIGLGIGITAAVGLFFGLYPASRAASLSPIQALGRE
ncbi:MAG: ABC transporter permease [Vicinamibacterales bacterium]